MEKVIYFLMVMAGVHIVYISACEFFDLFVVYRKLIDKGFCPEDMEVVYDCANCKSIADNMTAQELLHDKEDNYNGIKIKLKSDVLDKLFYAIFYLSITGFAIIKYLNY